MEDTRFLFFCEDCSNPANATTIVLTTDLKIRVGGYCDKCKTSIVRTYDIIALALEQEAAA